MKKRINVWFDQTSYGIWKWSKEKSNGWMRNKELVFGLIEPRIEYENEAKAKAIGEWKKKNRQTNLTKPHIEYEHETKAKVTGE